MLLKASVLAKSKPTFSDVGHMSPALWLPQKAMGLCLIPCPLKTKKLCSYQNWPSRGAGQQEPLVEQELPVLSAAISKPSLVFLFLSRF